MNAEYIVNNLTEGLITKKEAVTLIKEYARQACAEQRKLCSSQLRTRFEILKNVEVVESAPEPELL